MKNYLKALLFSKFLEDGETLFYSIHRHWILIYRKMIKIALFGILLPLLIIIFFTGFLNESSYFFYAWILFGFIWSLHSFFDWYMDAWLLTNISIIDVEWDGFFKQRSSRLDYESIESIDYVIDGFKQSVFNYGELILIKTSGKISVAQVGNPQDASHWIGKIRSERVANRKEENSEAVKDLLAEIIQERVKTNS